MSKVLSEVRKCDLLTIAVKHDSDSGDTYNGARYHGNQLVHVQIYLEKSSASADSFHGLVSSPSGLISKLI